MEMAEKRANVKGCSRSLQGFMNSEYLEKMNQESFKETIINKDPAKTGTIKMEVKGKLVKKLDVESGISKSEKVWKKQTVVIDTGAEYNPEIAVTAFGDDKLKDLDKLSVGDEVMIKCNVSSREYNGRYFHNIDGYWFAKTTTETAAPVESDDLPF